MDTVSLMIDLFCKAHHDSEHCIDCHTLKEYARKRLITCPFQENKPSCKDCSTHCYNHAMQESIKKVMRYSGPRMIFHYPLKAIKHYYLKNNLQI